MSKMYRCESCDRDLDNRTTPMAGEGVCEDCVEIAEVVLGKRLCETCAHDHGVSPNPYGGMFTGFGSRWCWRLECPTPKNFGCNRFEAKQ